MATSGKAAKGKGRNKGDWKAIATGRGRVARDLMHGTGLTNIPKVGEVGSAAYRRLQAGHSRHR